jgi:hypothetical protein
VLRESGLVRAEAVGRTRIYSLEASALAPVRDLLDHVARASGARTDSSSRTAPPTIAPIAAERFDALDLEVRRAARAPGDVAREEIA